MSRNATPSRISFPSCTRRAAVLVILGAIAASRPAAAQTDFSAQIRPSPVPLVAGGTAVSVTVTTTVTGALREPITYSFTGLPPGVTTGGPQLVIDPYPPVTFIFSAAAGVTPGAYTSTLMGVTSAITRTFPVVVTVVDAPLSQPTITSVSPPSVVAGTVDNVLRISGRNFDPNAVITSRSAAVRVVTARVLSSTAAEVTIAARPDARPGVVQLDLRNPDGGIAAGGARLLVYAARSLAAPVSVTSVALLGPRQWEIITPDDRARARALLATSGMGTIVGTWLLDGVPFDRFTRVVSGGFPVEVVSAIPIPGSYTGEHRLEMLIESPRGTPVQGVSYIQSNERRARIQLLAPTADATLDPTTATFRWTLMPGASGYELEIEDAGTTTGRIGESRRFRLHDTEWRSESILRELGSGTKRARVRAIYPGEVHGEPSSWHSFTIVAVDRNSATRGDLRRSSRQLASAYLRFLPTFEQDEPRGVGGRIGLTLVSTTVNTWSGLQAPPPNARLQLSTQWDTQGEVASQATADVSGMHDLDDPWRGRAENANWVAAFTTHTGRVEQEFRVGFAPPSFFDQSELLSVFSSGGALQGALISPAGRVSYYHSARLGGVHDVQVAEPDIEAAAYEAASADGRVLLRTMLLRARQRDADGLATGHRGTTVGVIGALDVSPRLQVQAEAARGDLEPGVDSFEEERDGAAFRVSAKGTTPTFGYGLTFGQTQASFVNAVNPGFTPGGVSGRTRAEVTLQRSLFGRAEWTGSHSWVRGGIALLAGDPQTTENATVMALQLPLGQRVAVAIGGNVTAQRGDGRDDLELPATDRTQRGAQFTVTEQLGPLTLTQAWTWQDLADDVDPTGDQSVTGLSLTATGAIASYLNLSVNVSDTRERPIPELGATSRLLIAVQPALTIGRWALTLAPRTTFSRARNDVLEADARTTQHQMILRWQPAFANSLFAFEIGSDWQRNWSAFDSERPPYERTTVASLSLNWSGDRAWGINRSRQ